MSALSQVDTAMRPQPLPEHLRSSVRINWHVTSWCNYSCSYCPVMIFHTRSAKAVKQDHAFDHHSVAEWLQLLKSFPQKDIHLKITGGEPFLDRRNFRDLLAGLTPLARFNIGIDTNGYWDPKFFSEIDKTRLWLNVSYHPTETPFDKFLPRVKALRDAGFRVATVNSVTAPENMKEFDRAFGALEKEGFFTNVSTMNPTGVYASRDVREDWELDLLRRYNTPLDVHYKIVKPSSKDRPCYYPALSYYMLYDGGIQIACIGQFQNAFTEGIPQRPAGAIACPLDCCIGCTDMYRAIEDEPLRTEPLKLFTLVDYAAETRRYRNRQRWKNAVRSLMPSFKKARPAFVEPAAAATPLVTIQRVAPVEKPAFGGIDGGPVVEARSRDRIALSGWVASQAQGAGVREVRVSADDREIGVVRYFHERPVDAARTGWRTVLFLPSLARGEHKVVATAVAADGQARDLGTVSLRIIE